MYSTELKVLDSDDIVYHYTSTEAALQYILNNKQLRLSPRISSADPIENRFPIIAAQLTGDSYEENDVIKDQTAVNFEQLNNAVMSKASKIRQICFCENNNDDFSDYTIKPLEYYGCMKPRMWEQYANNYNGVCLAFSLTELKRNLDEKLKPISMNYVGYEELCKNQMDVVLKELKGDGCSIQEDYCLSKLDNSIREKHCDYSGENEYRIYGYAKEEYIYIDFNDDSFTKALQAIIISSNNSSYYTTELKRFAKKYNADDIEIHWQSTMPKVFNMERIYERNKKIIKHLTPNEIL